MTIYISGPMSGLPDDNFPAFANAAKLLRSEGYGVVSPAEMGRLEGSVRISLDRLYAHRDTQAVIHSCTGILMLRGWHKSLGAACEFMLARWIARNEKDFLFLKETKDGYYKTTADVLLHDFALESSMWIPDYFREGE